MKFGAIYEEYLRAEQDKYLAKCSRIEYKRLKKVLKRCRVGRSLQEDAKNGHDQQEGNVEFSDVCQCNSCAWFFKNEFFKNFSCDLTGAQPILTMAISDAMKYDYSLTCPICLDTLFNPYALSCGHLFCKACACGAASVYIFQGVKSAPPEAKCPVCRAVGVFGRAVHMTELDLLLKTRDKDYWRQRLREERTDMVKQSKEYWDSQAMLSMGI
ncbi:hypothetical protein PR202_ga12849 [Eleusine coracana subsp. coracana]|uniref:RING-type domain-containing protein n=1 Tax=Eleusine coracana subsp. coracana TaxID=191504 RepID=A0AAV5CCQ9_ELECO|nr:hypothetical protein PR202_ga12849 [Eleusine coracana subsp. coracana]